MDLFKLGLRSVLGITLPGAIMLLVSAYVLSTSAFFLGLPLQQIFFWTKDQEILLLGIAFLVSYNLGALLRLNSADSVDRKSSKRLTRWYLRQAGRKGRVKKEADLESELAEARRKIETSESFSPDPEFDRWVWRKEPFPYPLWQFRKFQIYHPEEVLRFFRSYRSCMLGSSSSGRGKEFFNYCKMVVYHKCRGLNDPLLDEIHFSEATIRFYAGTYAGLRITSLLLSLLLIWEIGLAWWAAETVPPESLKLHVLATAGLLIVGLVMQRAILKRFRTLRLKEVDTVYDAFYLVHRDQG